MAELKPERRDTLEKRDSVMSELSERKSADSSYEHDEDEQFRVKRLRSMTSEQIRTATSMVFKEYSLAPFAHLDKVEMLYSEPSVAFDELSLSWNWAHVMARGEDTITRDDLRQGVPREGKRRAWLVAAHCTELASNSDFYAEKLRLAFPGREVPERLETSPEFGGQFQPWYHPILDGGVNAARRVLCAIGATMPELRYCPTLNDLSCALMIFLTENEAFCVLHSIMTEKIGTHPHTPGNKAEYRRFLSGTVRAVVKEVPKVTSHLSACGINVPDMINRWLSTFFVGTLPYTTILTLVDSYLMEGYKVLVRVMIAALRVYQNKILKTVGAGYMEDRANGALLQLTELLSNVNHPEMKLVLPAAFKIKLLKDKAFAAQSDDEDLNVSLGADNTFYIPQIEGSLALENLPIEAITSLWSRLPTRVRFLDAEVIFSTELHGMSTRTLLEKCGRLSPLLLLIRGRTIPKKRVIQSILSLTTLVDRPNKEEVPILLGALLSQPLGDGHPSGDGDTTVFSISPELQVYPFQPKATPHFVFASHSDGIFIGERTSPAIVLGVSMEGGRSMKCSTFGSPPLLGIEAEEYKTTLVEVLHLKDGL